MKTIFALLCCLIFAMESNAQANYRLIEKGNSAMKKELYSESELSYRKALEKDGKLTTAQYNIGNARYLQEDFEGAAAKFELSAEAYQNKQDKAAAYHNLGNSLMSQKKYEESINAYKNALKLNPSDMDTKYNLAYAQKMLKKEQEQQQQQEEQKEQDKDQPEDKKDEQEKDDKGDQKEEKEDEQKGDDKKDSNKDEGEKEKPQQPKDGKLTKEQAEQLLKMLEGEEAKLQEKLDKPEGEAVKISTEKDW
jgi:Ca-activated chloride channel homolog